MKARLKGLCSLEVDINTYRPPDEQCFILSLIAMIGVEDQDGSDSFVFSVCTPDWLKKHLAEPAWGNQMLIVNSFDLDQIRHAVEAYCDGCTGNDWQEIALKLSRMANWEFDNYRPFRR